MKRTVGQQRQQKEKAERLQRDVEEILNAKLLLDALAYYGESRYMLSEKRLPSRVEEK
jgi:hypothetical protein